MTPTRELFNLKVAVDGADKNILAVESFDHQRVAGVAPMMSAREGTNREGVKGTHFTLRTVGDTVQVLPGKGSVSAGNGDYGTFTSIHESPGHSQMDYIPSI